MTAFEEVGARAVPPDDADEVAKVAAVPPDDADEVAKVAVRLWDA